MVKYFVIPQDNATTPKTRGYEQTGWVRVRLIKDAADHLPTQIRTRFIQKLMSPHWYNLHSLGMMWAAFKYENETGFPLRPEGMNKAEYEKICDFGWLAVKRYAAWKRAGLY